MATDGRADGRFCNRQQEHRDPRHGDRRTQRHHNSKQTNLTAMTDSTAKGDNNNNKRNRNRGGGGRGRGGRGRGRGRGQGGRGRGSNNNSNPNQTNPNEGKAETTIIIQGKEEKVEGTPLETKPTPPKDITKEETKSSEDHWFLSALTNLGHFDPSSVSRAMNIEGDSKIPDAQLVSLTLWLEDRIIRSWYVGNITPSCGGLFMLVVSYSLLSLLR
jgi:hypothetical protein